MVVCYVAVRSCPLYAGPTGEDVVTTLAFGERVEIRRDPEPLLERTPARCDGLEGFIDEAHVTESGMSLVAIARREGIEFDRHALVPHSPEAEAAAAAAVRDAAPYEGPAGVPADRPQRPPPSIQPSARLERYEKDLSLNSCLIQSLVMSLALSILLTQGPILVRHPIGNFLVYAVIVYAATALLHRALDARAAQARRRRREEQG